MTDQAQRKPETAMEDKKNILLHLYGETETDSDLRELLRDEELRKEHQALSEAKFRLDHAGRERPDPATIERIIARAAAEHPSAIGKRPRADRPPLWRSRPLRRVLIPSVSIAAALVLAVGLGIFTPGSQDSNTPVAGVNGIDRSTLPESLLRPTPVDPNTVMQVGRYVNDPRLAWDDAEKLREYYRRIEKMRPANPLDWGESSVPLEMMPGANQPGKIGVRRAATQR